MKNIFNTFKTKANNMAIKGMIFKENCKMALANNRGEGYLDTVVKLLIAIVLGALLLAGLYALFNEIVMPRLEKEVTDMFDYKG